MQTSKHHTDAPAFSALITGGSGGIGYAIAESLAKRKYNLILVARDRNRLLAAKDKLESAYHIHVEVLINDMSREESADEIFHWCSSRDIPLKFLCNNAGIGGANDYLSASLESLRYMLRLNLESCIALTASKTKSA